MAMITDYPRITNLKMTQASIDQECLLHFDVSTKKYSFIAGTNCDQPVKAEEIGAGVTLGAVIQMLSEYAKKMGDSRTICIDYGRNIFDALLYNDDGSPSEVKGIRFYLGLRQNAFQVDELSFIMVPLDENLTEKSDVKNSSMKDKCGDNVGHGITTNDYHKNINNEKQKMVLYEVATK